MDNIPIVKNSQLPLVKLSLMDRFVSVFNPTSAIKRLHARASLSLYNTLGTTGWVTPGKIRRSMRGWFTSGGSADRDTLNDLPWSRNGSRDLYMNTPMATGALRRLRTNVINLGLTVQSRIDYKHLGITEEQATAWEKNTENEWRLWASSKNCDITRTNNFKQLQSLAFLSYTLSGDVFANLPYKPIKDFPYKLRIQLIESDQVSNPNGIENALNTKLRAGIEVDENGSPVAYHVRTKHPGDVSVEQKWVRVPVFGARSGRRNILHIFNKERPGQRRGMPFLAPVMEQLKQLTRLSDSELMGALVASFFTVFIKKMTGTRPLAEGFTPEESVQDISTDKGEKEYEMRSGNMITLGENEEVDIADPKRPNNSFEPFFLAIVKQLGCALEIPFEVLLMWFGNNYSASRGAILEAWKTFSMYRSWFVTDFCQPIYEAWLMEAVISGRISAPGFLTNPSDKLAWCNTRWEGIGQGQIDPMKETKASILRLRNNLSTYEDEAQINGNDNWEATAERLAKENKILEELGLLSDDSTETSGLESELETEEKTDDTDKV